MPTSLHHSFCTQASISHLETPKACPLPPPEQPGDLLKRKQDSLTSQLNTHPGAAFALGIKPRRLLWPPTAWPPPTIGPVSLPPLLPPAAPRLSSPAPPRGGDMGHAAACYTAPAPQGKSSSSRPHALAAHPKHKPPPLAGSCGPLQGELTGWESSCPPAPDACLSPVAPPSPPATDLLPAIRAVPHPRPHPSRPLAPKPGEPERGRSDCPVPSTSAAGPFRPPPS